MYRQLDFDWPSMRVALEGLSFIDVPKLHLKSKNEARQFLLSYGYNIDDPLVREEIWRLYFESLAFIRSALLKSTEKIPVELLQRSAQNEIERLLLDVSKENSDKRSKWVCAVLRVMHIISHLDNDVRLENFNNAREQIFGRFDSLILPSGPRRWKIGQGADSVSIVRYIKKQRKERNSILIKLLSKPTTIVEEIYDSLGFRFVTDSRLDVYRLMRQLFNTGAVSAANIQPGRSVNSLIDAQVLKDELESTYKSLNAGEISIRSAQKRLQKLEDDSLVSWGEQRNPLTSRWYRAVQFTCRQLIVAPDPVFRFWQEMKAELVKNPKAKALLKKIPITLRERQTFYYPFEIQILDKASYVEAIGGRSRHREYKQKQKLMARNRVLRDLV